MSEATGSDSTRSRRKVRRGRVVSDRMDKTVVVEVDRTVAHPLYGKRVKKHTRLYAHDPENAYLTGDIVRIEETRPLSRLKRWRVVELLERPE